MLKHTSISNQGLFTREGALKKREGGKGRRVDYL